MDITITCPCPGTPHPDGDVVTLRDKPTLRMGTTALGWASVQATRDQPTSGDITDLYLREGIKDWTFVLEDGTPRPLDDAGLDWLVEDYEVAYPIAEQAADLYTDVIFRPLVVRMEQATSSRSSRTNGSTSARSRRTRSPRSPTA